MFRFNDRKRQLAAITLVQGILLAAVAVTPSLAWHHKVKVAQPAAQLNNIAYVEQGRVEKQDVIMIKSEIVPPMTRKELEEYTGALGGGMSFYGGI